MKSDGKLTLLHRAIIRHHMMCYFCRIKKKLNLMVTFDTPSYDPCHGKERSDVGPKGMPVVKSPVSMEVPARFGCIFLPDGKENCCVARSSPRKRRSSAPHLVFQICPHITKIRTQMGSDFRWRYRPDLNWRITVLQTGALPLGYGTI